MSILVLCRLHCSVAALREVEFRGVRLCRLLGIGAQKWADFWVILRLSGVDGS